MVNLFSKPCFHSLRIFRKTFSPTVIRLARRSEFKKELKLAEYDTESYLNKKAVKNQLDPIGVSLLIIPLTSFGLAVWQYNRKQWKELLIEDMKLKTFIPAVDLPQDLSVIKNYEYRRVKVKGTFDHSKEMYISPRSLIEDNEFVKDENDGFMLPMPFVRKNRIGAVVVTPFKLSDRNLTILVNRGWVPNEKVDPDTRLEAQIEGEVELEGIVRLAETKPSFVDATHRFKQRLFRYRDIEEMAAFVDADYVFIDAVKESTVPGGPLGGQTQVKLKNDHLQYMITWIIVGTWLGAMWHRRWIRKLN